MSEIIDKLFLELSQVTNAVTKRELAIYMKLQELRNAVEPFATLVCESEGRIPIERLSFEHWHNLTKAFNSASQSEKRDAANEQ